MIESRRTLGSDLARLDLHEVQPWEYDDAPEMTDDWFARAVPHVGGRPVVVVRADNVVTGPIDVTSIGCVDAAGTWKKTLRSSHFFAVGSIDA